MRGVAMERIYNKLVRDKIPKIIEEKGMKAYTYIVDEDKLEKALICKLDEEFKEFIESLAIEELADIVEVVYAILNVRKVSLTEFEKIRLEKLENRGGFKEGIILDRVGEN